MTSSPKCWFTNSFFWPKLSGNNKALKGAVARGASHPNGQGEFEADHEFHTPEEYSYKEVRRWTIKAKIDVFEMDYIIFPMNIAETHWAMGAIDLKGKGFRYFDSMFSIRPALASH